MASNLEKVLKELGYWDAVKKVSGNEAAEDNDTFRKGIREREKERIAAQIATAPTFQKKKQDEDDIAPVGMITTAPMKDDGFFQKGAFSDGYQLGDISKTIISTGVDLGSGIVKGAAKLGGGLVDAGMYGIAAMADSYNKEYANELRVKAQENVIDAKFEKWDKAWDEYSVLGKTGDAVAEGLGQVGSIILTGGLAGAAGAGAIGATMATTGVMGASSIGSGMSEAYQSGATDEEAATYGLVKGAVDAGSELLFGGLGKVVKAVGLSRGLTSLDDVVAKKLSEKITNHLTKNLVQYGVKASGEGLEEVIAGVGSAMAKKATYMSDKELSQLLADENLMEQFVVGAVTSGVAQSGIVPGMSKGSLKESIQTGRDFVSGLSVNEQKVIDKELETRVAEAEKDGKKLTNKEKDKLYDAVVSDMERGYISTDTIEKVLGGDTYKVHKDTLDREKAMQEEYDTLYKMKNGEKSDEQIDRQADLKKQLEDIKRNFNRNELRDSVMSLVKHDRLSESYNERSRRGQAFTADLSKYDQKQRDTIQRAIDSGILNNTNRTHEFVDMVSKITADKGVSFDFTNNAKLKESGFAIQDKTINGFVTKDGVTLNIDSTKSLNSVVGHEITHVLEGTEVYTELQDLLFRQAKTKGEYTTRLNAIEKLYEGVEGADAKAELTADLVGDYLFTDADFVHNLSTSNRNLFQKVYDEIKYLCKVATAGSKEARELEKIKRAFEKAYKADSKAGDDTKYSVSDEDFPGDTNNEGELLTREQVEFFKDSVVRDENGNLKRMYHGTSNGGHTVFEPYGKARYGLFGVGSYFTDNRDVAESYTNKGKGDNKQVYETYLNIKNPIDMDAPADAEAWRKALPDVDFPNSGTNEQFFRAMEEDFRDMGYARWEAAETAMEVLEGMGFDGITHIGGGRFNKADDTRHRVYIAFQPEQIKNVDNAKPTDHPDIRYSLTDSDGKQLSKEQQAYFNESKVRDDDGRLKVVYHGTRKADFTVFKRNVNFFTDSKEMADSYSPNGEMFEGYLNIKKPYEIDAKGEKWSSIPIDAETKEWLEGYGSSVFEEGGEWRTTTDDLISAIEEAVDDGEMDYDGIIIKNVDDTGSYYKGEGSQVATDYIVFNSNQFKNADNATPTSDPDIRFSLSKIVGDSGTNYGIGVQLDSDLLAGLSDAERKQMVRLRVVEDLAGKSFIAYDNGVPVEISIAQKHDKIKNASGNRKPVLKELYNKYIGNEMKQEAVVLADELIEASKHKRTEASNYSHDWLDNYGKNDWDKRTVYLQDKNKTVWEATLHIANSADGRKILYDIDPIKMTEGAIKSAPTTVTTKVPRDGDNVKRQTSLSAEGEAPTRYGNYHVSGKDIALAPTISETESVAPVVDAKNATTTTVSDLFPDDIAPVGEPLPGQFDSLTDADAPPEMDAPYFGREDGGEVVETPDPMAGRFIEDVGSPKVNAYMYENPEVKPFFQEEAKVMLQELQDSTKGERWYNDQLYYESGGEHGWGGTQRDTSEDIAYLLDGSWSASGNGYTYDEIKKGLLAIIEDNGKENNACSKRIEFILNDRLRNGYTDFVGGMGDFVPANEDYLRLIEEKQITEYNEEALEAFLANADQYEPPVDVGDIAPDNTVSFETSIMSGQISGQQEVRNKRIDAPIVDEDIAPTIEDATGQQALFKVPEAEKKLSRSGLHQNIVDNIKSTFQAKGLDFDKVLKKAKNLSAFATVDNTPQRVMEKALGYKAGQILSDITVNKVAQNETEGIKWLNNQIDTIKQISKQYHIKPGSKESAAAQMYAEGFYVGEQNDIISYGDAELAQDFPNARVQANIKALAADPRIRQIYDETLTAINESRTRNAYPEIPRLSNYFLHFRAMEDTFSRLGLPFNPNDIRAKDLPTDLNGVTADLKPGQPYFASAMHRTGKRTSFDLLGGLERYLNSAKNQIYHIDDIQTLRALRNYIADTYGQAHGLENLDALSEEEAQERIQEVYGSHLSTFAKFLNEEANVLAGKTTLIDRGLEGIIGRRGITFLDTLNKQVGSNMVGYNLSSSLTNFLPVAQTFAKGNKAAFIKAFAQTVSHKISGRNDGFAETSPVMIRRKGADRFYRTPWQKIADPGYALMGAVDDISTELIARTKYNELVGKGMDSQTAHYETDKWVSKLMGDRSLGQQPQLYNSKMLGLVTKFQLEVRNQLDSQFYDTIQEAKVSNEHIQSELAKNAKTAAKVASTFVQLAVVQHLFGKVFESVAGYNPAFDIIEVLMTAFGFDDEEDSEDTAGDNIEQALLALAEDLPYASTFLDGGRIPISSALPIEQLAKGVDEWGNEKSRWETLGEIAPYYVLPGGYGQIKKTVQGFGMFSEDHPIAGSYTDSGDLRFPVEDTVGNRVKAGIFGQWANKNARNYFDNDLAPLDEKRIQEYSSLGLSYDKYWAYRDDMSEIAKRADADGATDEDVVKSKYIDSVDKKLSEIQSEKMEVLDDAKLTAKEKEARIRELDKQFADLANERYNAYGNVSIDGDYANIGNSYYQWYKPESGDSYWRKLTEEQTTKYLVTSAAGKNAHYATNGTVHYRRDKDGEWTKISDKQLARQREVTRELGITPDEYWRKTEVSFIPMTTGEHEYAYENPGNYSVAKAVGGYDTYMGYKEAISGITADKDKNGNSISGSKKEKVTDYINGLDLDYGEKIILYRSMYSSKADKAAYNARIVEYLNSRDDISYDDMVAILEELDMTVSSDGTVAW